MSKTPVLLLAEVLPELLSAAVVEEASLVLVDAKDEAAAGFYESLGFVRLEDKPLTLFLPVSKIADGVRG